MIKENIIEAIDTLKTEYYSTISEVTDSQDRQSVKKRFRSEIAGIIFLTIRNNHSADMIHKRKKEICHNIAEYILNNDTKTYKIASMLEIAKKYNYQEIMLNIPDATAVSII